MTRFAYITAPNMDEARSIAKTLLEKKLAGCVNLYPNVESHFVWEGKLDVAQEVVMIVKTEDRLEEAVTEEVRSQHSYRCPCILFFTLEPGNPAFVQWLQQNLR